MKLKFAYNMDGRSSRIFSLDKRTNTIISPIGWDGSPYDGTYVGATTYVLQILNLQIYCCILTNLFL